MREREGVLVSLVTVGTGCTCNGAQYQYNGHTVKVLPVMEISPVAFGTGSCNHVAYGSMLLEEKKHPSDEINLRN